MSSTILMKPVSTTKRNRTTSQSSGSSTSSRQYVVHKSTRISASPPAEEAAPSAATSHPLLCTLPPTCSHKPTPLANTKELESHYATYHAHVCEQRECGCVFPDARLLELHQTENHDPLAAMRKERDEKIFACHLASCPRLFANPKARRLHLISAHGYPKEYFFAVTNKGVGGLLKKWGEGASMVRGKWAPRDPIPGSKGKGGASNPQMEVDKETIREKMDVDEDDSDSDDASDDDNNSSDDEQTTNKGPKIYTTSAPENTTSKSDNIRMLLDHDPEATPRPPVSTLLPPTTATPPTVHSSLPVPAPTASRTADPSSLSAGFSSLSLVPPSVRFGRGGKVGFSHHRPSHQRQPSQPESDAIPVTVPVGTTPPSAAHHDGTSGTEKGERGAQTRGRGGTPSRGRGVRGRGRGRGGGGRGI